MKRVDVVFDIKTFWQVASGGGSGRDADSVVVRGFDGLPVVPGKSVKGLFREALHVVGYSDEQVENLLGTEPPPDPRKDGEGYDDRELERKREQHRFKTKPGELSFTSAVLPEAWSAFAQTKEGRSMLGLLFRRLASTAVSAEGVAKDKSLRVFEVTVPMELRASVDGPDEGAWVEALKQASGAIWCLGAKRHRGYGRVAVKVEETR